MTELTKEHNVRTSVAIMDTISGVYMCIVSLFSYTHKEFLTMPTPMADLIESVCTTVNVCLNMHRTHMYLIDNIVANDR